MDQLFVWINFHLSTSTELVPFMLQKLALAFALISMTLFCGQSSLVLGKSKAKQSEA